MKFFKGHFFRLVLLFTLLLPVLAAPAYAASVEIEGNQRVDTETIQSYFTGTDPAAINKAVKDLYATGLFSDIRVERRGGEVIIHVVENNVINRVFFEGNSKVKSDQLQSEIQSKNHGPFSQV
ncbi:MAG TPA: outer membrane protein assembly factor BamA, partial [Methylovirgula sp.]